MGRVETTALIGLCLKLVLGNIGPTIWIMFTPFNIVNILFTWPAVSQLSFNLELIGAVVSTQPCFSKQFLRTSFRSFRNPLSKRMAYKSLASAPKLPAVAGYQ